MDAFVARKVVQLLRVDGLGGVILRDGCRVLPNEGRLLRLSKHVPIDDVAVGFSYDEEIVSKYHCR